MLTTKDCTGRVENQEPNMNKVSKGFYVGSHLSPLVLSVVMIIWVVVANQPVRSLLMGGILPAIGVIMLMAAIVYGSIVRIVLLYKSWAAIQDEKTRTDADKAVGFLFCPFFKIYWRFEAYGGFAKEYNRYLERHRIKAPKLLEGLFLSFPVINLCLIVSIVIFWVILVASSAIATQGGVQSPAVLFGSMSAVFGVYGLLLVGAILARYIIVLVMIVEMCNGINCLSSAGQSAEAALYCVCGGEFQGNKVPLPSEGIIIGRSAQRAHLILPYEDVSEVHVEVRPDPTGAGVWIRDLQSTNGTYYRDPGTGASPDAWKRLNGEKLIYRGGHFRIAQGAAEFQVA
jgi:hypothetical protein